MATNAAYPVKQSLGRALHHGEGDVFDTFYRIFLDCDSRVPEQFVNTDWQEQKRLLRQGVNNVVSFYDGSVTSQHALERIRYTHGHDRMNIPPVLYDCWVESMIDAIRQYDPEFGPELERQWREVLRHGADYVKAGYEE